MQLMLWTLVLSMPW